MRSLALRGQHLLRGGIVLPVPLLDFDFTKGVLPGTLTFARSGIATTHDSTGKIITVADGIPRFDYDPSTLAPRGIRIEAEARQNLLSPSVNWRAAQSGSSTQDAVVQNAGIAPDGTNTAMAYIGGAGYNIASHQFFRGWGGSTSTTYTRSIFIKAFGCLAAYVSLENTAFGSNSAAVSVDLTNGSIIGQSSGSGYAPLVIPYPNGWYRLIVTATSLSTSGNYVANVRWFNTAAHAVGFQAWTGDGTSGILVWGEQVELGDYASSYIPTTSGPATRNSETLSCPLPSGFSQTQGSLAHDFIFEGRSIPGVYGTPCVLVGANAGQDWLNATQWTLPQSAYPVNVTQGRISIANTSYYPPSYSPAVTIAMGASSKDAISWQQGGVPNNAHNGQLAVGGGSSVLTPATNLTTLAICAAFHFQGAASGWTRRLRLWNTAISPNQLVQVTS